MLPPVPRSPISMSRLLCFSSRGSRCYGDGGLASLKATTAGEFDIRILVGAQMC